MEELKIEYKGAEIEYSEYLNVWVVKVGADRVNDKCVSLSAAKEVVDKYFRKERMFKELEAWRKPSGWNGNFVRVKVTSKSENEDCYWISRNGRRSKESTNTLVAVTAENELLINEIIEIEKKIKKLQGEKESKDKQLTMIPEKKVWMTEGKNEIS